MVSAYRACLTLSGPVSITWKGAGREDHRVLVPGDFCTESPGAFRWLSWDVPLDFLRLEISPEMMADLSGAGNRTPPELGARLGFRDANLEALMKMLRMSVTPSGPSSLFCQQLGRTLAAYLLERYCVSQTNRGVAATRLPGKILKEVLLFIDERIAEPIEVKDLARQAGMSRFYFSRLFRNTVGRSPAQYVIDRRMDRAKVLLGNLDISLAEVTRRTGFSSESSFASSFRSRIGSTPSRYRRNLR
jgi:AraC family transcriptional regulator